MFIVEGPDGSGKSTFIEYVKNRIVGFESRKYGGPPDSMKGIFDRIEDMRITNNMLSGKVIFDRFTGLSELIYGNTLRGSSLVPYIMVENWLEKNNIILLYARPSNKVLEQRMIDHHKRSAAKDHKPQELSDAVYDNYSHIREAYDMYMQELRRAGICIIQFDPTDPKEANLVLQNIARYTECVVS